MKILVTGGAGFIGRWVVDQLLRDHHQVWVLDDLSNGRQENLEAFYQDKNFMDLIVGDIKDQHILNLLFNQKFDICFHLAASINVQDSIDDSKTTFENDVIGSFNVLERCRIHNVKMVFMSTCMVYQKAYESEAINEKNPVKPASPYAGSKLAAENMCLSYYHSYGLPITVIRPFNTYGPYQKTGGEGGVVAIFLKNKLAGQPLEIYGDGKQTRDLLYVEDCARFILKAGYSDQVNGEIVNAGLGEDISINKLAELIVDDQSRIKHIEHIHPQSEIPRLVCDYQKAQRLLDWKPSHSLKAGIKKTESWIQSTNLI